MRIYLPIALIALAAPASAQQGQRLTLPQEAAINLPSQPIGPSDLLTVTIYNQPLLSRTVRVATDGFVRLQMLKQLINASGLLPGALETLIAKAYIDEGILIDPQVTVNIAEYHSHPIQVGGSVKKPVTFQAEAPVTLLEALSKAEGLSDTAGSEILVTKKGEPTRRIAVKSLFEAKDESANLVLTGGEEIRIPEAGRVFVVGNVKKPCNYLIKQGGQSSVMEALTYSEGTLTYTNKTAFIYRREGGIDGKKNEIEVHIQEIKERKSPDVALLPDDILYIPENAKRKLTLGALEKILLIGGGAAATALVVYR